MSAGAEVSKSFYLVSGCALKVVKAADGTTAFALIIYSFKYPLGKKFPLNYIQGEATSQ